MFYFFFETRGVPVCIRSVCVPTAVIRIKLRCNISSEH